MIISTRTRCKNGVSLSIQANRLTYCTPRTDVGPWTHFEVGYVRDSNNNEIFPYEFEKFMVDDDGIYANVPKEVINKFIFKNGGPIEEGRLIDYREPFTVQGNNLDSYFSRFLSNWI